MNILKYKLFIICFYQIQILLSEKIIVKDISQFDLIVENANPNDIIIIPQGEYTNTTMTINKNDLTITADKLGEAIFKGENRIILNGNGNKIIGLQFLKGKLSKPGGVIEVLGNNNTISHCNWRSYSSEKYIILKEGTQYNEIKYCNFEAKPESSQIGSMIQILPLQGVPNYHKISFSTFQNFEGKGGDYGNEPIRIGLGVLSNFPSRTIIEYCYWNNTGLADSESISVKSMENVIRYNIFDNNKGGMLVFRNGDRNIAYGNIFIRGSGGIRIKEANDILVFNNYFDSSSGMKNPAIAFDYVSGNSNNIKFIHNTFYESSIHLGTLASSKMNTSIYFVNNIFYKTFDSQLFYADKKILYLHDVSSFQDNIFYTTDDYVSNDKSIFVNNLNYFVKPEFRTKLDGSISLSKSYPSNYSYTKGFLFEINGIQNYSDIRYDINNYKRSILGDIGSEEYTKEMSNELKNLNLERGPSYLSIGSIKIDSTTKRNNISIDGTNSGFYFKNELSNFIKLIIIYYSIILIDLII